MQLVSSVWDIFSATMVFIVGIVIALTIATVFGVTKKRSVTIYFWHTIFCFIYSKYVIVNGGDAGNYYATSFLPNIEFSVGTAGVALLTRLFSYVLGLSFLGVFLIFNIFGFIGLIAFDASLKTATSKNSKYSSSRDTYHIFTVSKFLEFCYW